MEKAISNITMGGFVMQDKQDVNIDYLGSDIKKEISKIDRLKDIVDDTELTTELMNDFIEGETHAYEMLDMIWQEIEERNILITGLKDHINNASSRKARLEGGVDKLRAVMSFVMKRAEQKKIVRPLYTISLRDVAEKLIIEEESEIPTPYYKQPDPVLDKKKLTADLKEGHEIPGAFLSEKGFSVTIRNK